MRHHFLNGVPVVSVERADGMVKIGLEGGAIIPIAEGTYAEIYAPLNLPDALQEETGEVGTIPSDGSAE